MHLYVRLNQTRNFQNIFVLYQKREFSKKNTYIQYRTHFNIEKENTQILSNNTSYFPRKINLLC